MRWWFCTALLALAWPLAASAQDPSPLPGDADLAVRVLHAAGYADLQRIGITRDCARNSAIAQAVPACRTIAGVPDRVIEQAATADFARYVTPDQARTALAFWSSPEGATISKTLLREIAEERRDLLSPEALELLGRFNRSEAGQAMARFAEDRAVAVAVIRAIGRYPQ